MRIKEMFVLQKVADEFILVPIGEEADRLKGIIKLNTVGAFLWKQLSENDLTENELVKILECEYSVDNKRAQNDVTAFLESLDNLGCIER